MTHPMTGDPMEVQTMTDTQHKLTMLLIEYWTLDRLLALTTDPTTRALIEANKNALSDRIQQIHNR